MSDADAMATLTVAPSSSAEPYTSEGYPSNDQLDASSTDAAAAGTNGDMNSSQVDSEQAPSHGVVEGTTVELTQAAASYGSTNGDGVDNTAAAISGENGNICSDGHGTVVEEFTDGVVLSAEEERLWSIVRANSSDFNAWTALIDETEKVSVDNIVKIRKVYDTFLAEFPLCYGYWKKYADHELRMGAFDKVVEVYERAVQGVTYSVDIWLHYCTFAIDTYGDPDTIRRLFERGLEYVGTDYLSHTLWDKYIEYECTQQLPILEAAGGLAYASGFTDSDNGDSASSLVTGNGEVIRAGQGFRIFSTVTSWKLDGSRNIDCCFVLLWIPSWVLLCDFSLSSVSRNSLSSRWGRVMLWPPSMEDLVVIIGAWYPDLAPIAETLTATVEAVNKIYSGSSGVDFPNRFSTRDLLKWCKRISGSGFVLGNELSSSTLNAIFLEAADIFLASSASARTQMIWLERIGKMWGVQEFGWQNLWSLNKPLLMESSKEIQIGRACLQRIEAAVGSCLVILCFS